MSKKELEAAIEFSEKVAGRKVSKAEALEFVAGYLQYIEDTEEVGYVDDLRLM